jgi:dihydrodipicolinate synthase/N-acetylneuraminate lyase
VTELFHTVRQERLWVPLLTHFDDNGHVDAARTAAHIRAIRPFLSGYLLAGSTGAGWAIDDAQFEAVLELGYNSAAFDPDSLMLIGCLRPTTEQVIARARMTEQRYKAADSVATYVGLTICPPVGVHSPQQSRDHFEKIMDATESPIAVYQLPQVTQCEIEPATMTKLIAGGRVHMFKDTSGEDHVAQSGVLGDAVWTLRGAEGGYYEALAPAGMYHGWLLSTANGLARYYRALLEAADKNDENTARSISGRLTRAIMQIFELAGSLKAGNAFSNANRAIDHVQAYGAACLEAPMPRRFDASQLPIEFIREVKTALEAEDLATSDGYL